MYDVADVWEFLQPNSGSWGWTWVLIFWRIGIPRFQISRACLRGCIRLAKLMLLTSPCKSGTRIYTPKYTYTHPHTQIHTHARTNALTPSLSLSRARARALAFSHTYMCIYRSAEPMRCVEELSDRLTSVIYDACQKAIICICTYVSGVYSVNTYM